MKVFRLIYFLLAVEVKASSYKNLAFFSSAFKNISTKFCGSTDRQITVINYKADMKVVEDVVLKNLKNEQTPYKLIDLSKISMVPRISTATESNNRWNPQTFDANDSSIITINTVKSQEEFFTTFGSGNNFPKKFQFFVICFEAKFQDILSFKANYKNHDGQQPLIQHLYFLIEEKNFVKLLTFVWYSYYHCNSAKLVEVNRFSRFTRRWKSDQFSINKFDTFYGCDLLVHAHTKYPNFDSKTHCKSSTHLLLLHQKILRGLANQLNYGLKYADSGKNYNFIHDLQIRTSPLNTYRKIHNNYFITRPYIFIDLQLAVPVGQLYNGYEKLILPFDLIVWLLILLTFLLAFVTIFILRFASEKVKGFVIGRTVATPSLNIFLIFFGIAQIRVPGRNFARFLVMSFILFSLIIRTAWQGKMFEFLQKDMRKAEVRSINEIISKNFTFYLEKGFNVFYSSLTSDKKLQFVSSSLNELVYNHSQKLQDPTFKGVVHVFQDLLHFIAIDTNGTFLMRLMKERLFLEMYGWEMNQYEKLYEIFDHKLQQLFTGGLIEFYDREYKEQINPKRYKHLQGPFGAKVLTMVHLQAGFVVWLVSVSLSFFVFIYEWTIKLYEYLMVKFIVQEFYALKHSKFHESRFFDELQKRRKGDELTSLTCVKVKKVLI